jgi:hypothetical protein
MKKNLLKISIIFLLLSLIGAGCEKEKIDYADESIKVSSLPGISIYKTRGDYFNLISLQLTSSGQLNEIPDYILSDPRIKVDDNERISPNMRWRLKSGYIVDKESNVNRIYTNIDFQEYVDYNTANKVACWPNNLIEPRIIDKNPFTEFYHYDGLNQPEKNFTLGEINTMIEEGTLETVFTKFK